ncbi:MAG: SprT-like domain-containing protein, partial [Burkholderiaceae bacterium]
MTREAWLLLAVDAVAPIFHEKGFQVPRVRVSCAIPSTSVRGSAVGQCWGRSMSEDGVNEIFISPVYSSAIEVLDTLVHELVHAVDDCQHRHGPEFKKIALAVGLQGKMREASAGPELKVRLTKLALDLEQKWGPYPHAKLRVMRTLFPSPKLSPRAACPICGFRVSVLMKYIDVGPPICPKDMVPMERKGKW